MAWHKGTPRPESSGRKKGTPNRKTELLMEKCERLGIDPFEALLELTKTAEDDIRLGALKEICQYLYPKRKSLEHSGEMSNPYADKSFEELKELVKEKLK